MTDLKTRFGALDDLAFPFEEPPERRITRPLDLRPSPARRAGIALLALAVAAAGFAFALSVFRGHDAQPAVSPTETSVPELANGLLAFTATPPREEPEGSSNGAVSSANPGSSPPQQVYTANPDGSGVRQLTSDAAYKGSLAWSPDGTQLAFVAYDTDREVESLRVMDANGSNVHTVCEGCTGAFYLAPTGDGDAVCVDYCNSAPSARPDALLWSPDATWLAAPATIDSGITLIDPFTGAVQAIDTVGSVSGLSWAPDGARLAVGIDHRGDVQGGIYLLDVATSTLTQLADLGARDNEFTGREPNWSPDGGFIEFQRLVRIDGAIRSELFVVNENGADEQMILDATDNFGVYDVDWSPDGLRLAAVYHPVDPPTAALLTLSADGSDVTTIALCENGKDRDGLCPPNDGRVEWSPDGKLLAFANYADTGRSITLLALDGHAVTIPAEANLMSSLSWQAALSAGSP